MRRRQKRLVELAHPKVGRTLVEIAPQPAVTALDTAGAVHRAPTPLRALGPVLWAGPQDGGAPPEAPDPAEVLPADFAMSISFGDGCCRLAVRGELDVLTAAAFGGFLDLAATRRGTFVVVDLAELDFLDASGLGQLAGILPRLRQDGGDLTIVSPSRMVYKVLDLTGLTGEVEVQQPAAQPSPAPAGPAGADPRAGAGAAAGAGAGAGMPNLGFA